MLNHRVALYVPSTLNGNETAPAELVEKFVRQAKIKLAQLFGGFTSYKADGGWYSPTLGLVEEPVTIVQAFTDESNLKHVAAVEALAAEIAAEMGQEAVSVEVDNELRFITAVPVTVREAA